jgi:hypothetical protein
MRADTTTVAIWLAEDKPHKHKKAPIKGPYGLIVKDWGQVSRAVQLNPTTVCTRQTGGFFGSQEKRDQPYSFAHAN